MGRKLIYGIYPRSFVDEEPSSNLVIQKTTDAMGEKPKNRASAFQKIAAASHKFLQLDPDYVWMNPIFTSGGCDGGYDIVSPFHIDPIFGTEKEFRDLCTGPLKDKLLLDIVFNHVSVQSDLFVSDFRRTVIPCNCIWCKTPNNWESLFGGPAWEYREECDRYYLHLFDKGQADVDLRNPKVIRYFQLAVQHWLERGVAGFRVDTCNILDKRAMQDSDGKTGMPRGFEFYHQIGSCDILNRIFGANQPCFTVGETVAADVNAMRELSGALTCCFNAGVNDAADGMFLSPATRRETPDYKAWFLALITALGAPNFCFQLESHDFPRSVDRFHADPRALAMLAFTMPFDYVALYQGQELGMRNRTDLLAQRDIVAYTADPHARGLYEALMANGKTEDEALLHIDSVSRLHARVEASKIFNEEYTRQMADANSVWNLYRTLIQLWKNDPVLLYGNLEVNDIGKNGVFSYSRVSEDGRWDMHIDLLNPRQSRMTNNEGTTIT